MKSKATLISAGAIIISAIVAGCNRLTLANPAPTQQATSVAQAQQLQDPRLTKYDLEVASPQIKVGSDGTIHVLFVESTKVGIEDYVFYRSSKDGGKSWSAAINLSEDMAGHMVGPCRLAIDSQNRVYAVWRVQALPNVLLVGESHTNSPSCNLVYRVLDGGAWTPINPVNSPVADPLHQLIGAQSYFAGADPAGKVHVAYVVNTDIFHPELMFQAGTPYAQHQAQMGTGSIAEVDLDGATHSAPREVFLSPVTTTDTTRACDSLDVVDGYFDVSGAPHLVAMATASYEPFGQSRIVMVEEGKQTTAISLPSPAYRQYTYPPALLVDAQGRSHIIVDFAGGEQHTVRDYIGTTGQYTVLATETPVISPIRGFQAGQGPSGTMGVVMEMDASGLPNDCETWVAVYDGKAWRQAVQVTDYKSMSSATAAALGLSSSVATVGHWNAGYTGAVAVDSTGHILLIHEADQFGNFAIQGGAVTGVGLGTRSPKLLFHRF